MPYKDSRVRSTGRHPDLGQRGLMHAGIRKQTQRDLADLEDTMRSNIDPSVWGGAHNYATVDHAAVDLGMDAERTREARVAIAQVAADARDLLTVSKACVDAGIPRDLIPEVIRRGLALRQRLTKAEAGAELAKAAQVKTGGPYTGPKGGKWADPKMTIPWKEGKGGGKGGKGEGAKAGSHDSSSHDDPEVRARYHSLAERAKKVGKVVGAKVPLQGHHTHEHLDHLEARIKEHEDAKAKYEPQDPGKGSGEASEAAGGGEEPPAIGTPKPGIDKPQGAQEAEGHDVPKGPHQKHAAQQEVHDTGDQLREVEGRLDSPGQKAMHKELLKENDQVRRSPSPQAHQWHQKRVQAFLMLIGAAAGAAMGADVVGGAGAGAVEGQTSRLPPGAVSAPEEAARKQAQEGGKEGKDDAGEKPKKPEPKPAKPGKPEEKPVKKGLYIDRTTGKLLFKAADSKDPAEEDEEEVSDPTEAVPDPIVRLRWPGPPRNPAGVAKSRRRAPPPPVPPRRKARAPRNVNAFGHRDDLTPGMLLKAKDCHGGHEIEVLDGGRFAFGGGEYDTAKAMLDALHKSDRHKTTVRRYFALGGERSVRSGEQANELRTLLKAEPVLVQRMAGGVLLTGDLAKARLPEAFLPFEGAQFAEVPHDAVPDLIGILRGRE